MTGNELDKAITRELDRLHSGAFQHSRQLGAVLGWLAYIAPNCGEQFLASLKEENAR